MTEMKRILRRHGHGPAGSTVVPGLRINRSEVTTGRMTAPYDLLFCVIAEGRKRVFMGNEALEYDPMTYLVASLNLPVAGQVIEAPYLAFSLELDSEMLASILLTLPSDTEATLSSRALGVSRFEPELLDPVMRLVRLLDHPGDIPILAPLIQREILYRLLLGPHGRMLRQLALPTSRFSQISRAVQHIRERFDQAIPVETLARLARMSLPTFHRHFRAVTAMSPHQFQKQIRLQEARLRLLSGETDAATIGFQIGYESPSQFSREYRQFFGEPPARHTRRTRAAMSAGLPALRQTALV